MPSPLAEAFLMGILNGCYETPSKFILQQNSQYQTALIQCRIQTRPLHQLPPAWPLPDNPPGNLQAYCRKLPALRLELPG